MKSLLEAVRAATASGATTEQEEAGVLACRTIIAALDTKPFKPIVLPGTPSCVAARGASVTRVQPEPMPDHFRRPPRRGAL